MYREDEMTTASGHYGPIHPVDPQTQRLRACLKDTLDNLLVSVFGDEAERDGAVEDLASVEICLHKLSLGRKLASLPFTFTPIIRMSKLILGLRPEEYQQTDLYRDAIRRLFYMLHVESPYERYQNLARSILNAGDHHLAVEAIMRGENWVEPQTMLDEANPEHQVLLEQYRSLWDGHQDDVRLFVRYFVLQQQQAFWTDVVDRLDDVTAARILTRVTGGERKTNISGPLDDLLSTIDARPFDKLLITGALRRRLFGPAKHWMHDFAARKPYLEFVVREAVEFAVQTLHSPKPRTEEAVAAIKYAFSEIRRSLIHLTQTRTPEFIEQTPWNEQCRTVVRTAGLTTRHADVLAAALEIPRQFNREESARIFSGQLTVSALSVLVVRTLPIENARTFLQQTVLRRVAPATPDMLRKTIKSKPAPDWPRSLQFGLFMRLNLPPREPPRQLHISTAKSAAPIRRMSGRQPAWPGSTNAAIARTAADLPPVPAGPPPRPAASHARGPAAIAPTPPRERASPRFVPAARRLQGLSRACEQCLTM